MGSKPCNILQIKRDRRGKRGRQKGAGAQKPDPRLLMRGRASSMYPYKIFLIKSKPESSAVQHFYYDQQYCVTHHILKTQYGYIYCGLYIVESKVRFSSLRAVRLASSEAPRPSLVLPLTSLWFVRALSPKQYLRYYGQGRSIYH
jgi:hypothetical protein